MGLIARDSNEDVWHVKSIYLQHVLDAQVVEALALREATRLLRIFIEDDAKLLIEATTQKAFDNSEAHSILQDAVKMLVSSHSIISLHFTRRDFD